MYYYDSCESIKTGTFRDDNTIQSFTFCDDFNKQIEPGSLPPKLKSLIFGEYFDQILLPGSLPPTLEVLVLSENYDQPFLPGVLPTTLKSLIARDCEQISEEFIIKYRHNNNNNNNNNNYNTEAEYLQCHLVVPLHYEINVDMGEVEEEEEEDKVEEVKEKQEEEEDIEEGEEFISFYFKNKTLFNLIISYPKGEKEEESEKDGAAIENGVEMNLLGSVSEYGSSTFYLPYERKKCSKFRLFVFKDNDPSVLSIDCDRSNSYSFQFRSYQKYSAIDKSIQSPLLPILKQHIINEISYDSLTRFGNSANGVFLVRSQLGKLCVYKRIKYETHTRHYSSLLNEIKAMELLENENKFVKLVDYLDEKDIKNFHIITEYCSCGDLQQLFNHKVEAKRIIHCDIKPSNIFMTENDQLVLGDFGCCIFLDGQSDAVEDLYEKYNQYKQTIMEKELQMNSSEDQSEPSVMDISEEKSTFKATRGTLGFIPPEAKFKLYFQSFDIFSIGSTILKLLSCHEEDRGNHNLFKFDRIIKISDERYSKNLKDLVCQLLDSEPKNRESIQRILNKYSADSIRQNTMHYDMNLPLKAIPEYITELEFGDSFDQPIPTGLLPKLLKQLTFGFFFRHELRPGVLPLGLEYLRLGHEYDYELKPGVLPPSLKTLEFAGPYEVTIRPGVLPGTLETIYLGSCSTFIEPGVLPSSLKSLTFPGEYNYQIPFGVLPNSLETLAFDDGYELEIDEQAIPLPLKTLTVGETSIDLPEHSQRSKRLKKLKSLLLIK
ncbi:hypothetical protein PPL_07774 [Heterostelium album PN500]|uniref:Protein kinase domain-containing protein n=1 Tax=Heterostelium pallidum (strain ATCC 26659 / Pp 5 / PN500) TaxID=670386 RepID=D3BGX2_HETP5|nr:hypothetical protein PPL_07774 [Heterostelium album PN500]EFA79356.1 hypothetical protein PPL_07774 [Heterostelium album PN500]|eukprot:XP_020431477.1 hypothetical protein PPL_07774 [Heterostelium album PN500]